MNNYCRVYFYCIALFALICNFAVTGCRPKEKNAKAADTLAKAWNKTIPGSFSSQSAARFDSTQLSSFINKYPGFKLYAADMYKFYKARHYAYAWYEKGLLIEQAGNLASRVLDIKSEGIYKDIPYQTTLDSLMFGVVKKKPDLNLELMLTAQYFVFSHFAWQGMGAAVSKANDWFLPRKKVAYDEYLDSLLKAPAKKIAAVEPVYRQYELLRNYLRVYQAIEKTHVWQPVKINNTLKAGDSAAVISTVKARLFQLGDFGGDTLSHVYDEGLVSAVKSFQQRNGLNANGLLNRPTLAELNVPLKSRIKTILVNMERSRWLPVRLEGDYMAVNIPEYKLHVYHADSLLWSCNVVVGQTMHQTTVFYGEIKYVVFSPYWNVPQSIVKNEVVPAMKKDPGYINTHRMEITGREDGLPVIRQKPGAENSLGLVKFLFPNSYNIYLHDTPSKSLFNESSRAFSHGCIRVEQPAKLAGFLLNNWDDKQIYSAMHSGKERYVTLKNGVAVFIAYFTAFIDRDNKLNFRKDIYKLDDQLAGMILSGKGDYQY